MYLDRNIHYIFCLMCRKLTFFLKLSLFTSNISKNFPNYLFDSFAFTVSLVRRYYLFYYVNVAEEDSVCFSVSAFHKSSEGDLFFLAPLQLSVPDLIILCCMECLPKIDRPVRLSKELGCIY